METHILPHLREGQLTAMKVKSSARSPVVVAFG
jgi:hypothetical protein